MRTLLVAFVIAVLGSVYLSSLRRPSPSPVPAPPPPPPARAAVEPSPASAASPADVIAGLMPVDVYGNLASRGFVKTGPKPDGAGGLIWHLEERTASALNVCEVYGPSAATVRSFRAIAAGLGGAEPRVEFLEFLSTVPYRGADPAAARQWVSSNLRAAAGAAPSTTIGGVTFTLERTSASAHQLTVRPTATTSGR